MAFQGDKLDQRDDACFDTFKLGFLRLQLHATEDIVCNKHQVHRQFSPRWRIELQESSTIVMHRQARDFK